MNALATTPLDRPDSGSVGLVAPPVRIVDGGAGAAGEPQPPMEAANTVASLPRPAGTLLRSAFGDEPGPMSEAYAAISSGLFTLGGLAVRMARSLRAGSARW